MIVVLSYRREYRLVFHGDQHASASNESDLAMHCAADETAAVAFIVKRLLEDPAACFLHVLFTSWEGLVEFSGSGRLPNADKAEDPWKSNAWNRNGQCIMLARPEVDYEREGWEEREAKDLADDQACDRISKAVSARLIETGPPGATKKNAFA